MTKKSLLNRSRGHLDAAGESYLAHLGFASRTSGALLLIALRLLVHGLVPGWFEFGASDRISRLHAALQKRAQLTHPAHRKRDDRRPQLVRSGSK
jgi:hypothetical protein